MVWVGFMVFSATFNNISVISWWLVIIGGGNWRIRRKPPTCRKSLTNFYHIMLYISPLSIFELTTSVVIGTDCTGSCKSNYHMTTTTPHFKETLHAGVEINKNFNQPAGLVDIKINQPPRYSTSPTIMGTITKNYIIIILFEKIIMKKECQYCHHLKHHHHHQTVCKLITIILYVN